MELKRRIREFIKNMEKSTELRGRLFITNNIAM